MSENVVKLFEKEGGEFISPPSVFIDKLKRVKVVLFDWDGVFNDGTKRGNEGSIFSEVDAMGTNLLRYTLWRLHGKIPVSAIMTGEQNPLALHFAKRESFHAVYSGSKNKVESFAAFCQDHQHQPHEVLFFFDDVLDLEVALQCGARILVGRNSSLMLRKFVKDSGLADYITHNDGSRHGLREGAELVIGLLDQFETVVKSRMVFSEEYQTYLAQRRLIETVHTDKSK